MKKIFAVALCALMALPMLAGKTAKEWNFSLNEDGECIVEETFTTGKDAAAALKAVKACLNKQSFEKRSTVAEEAGVSIAFDFTKNTKSNYNPFAGSFQESMAFKMVVTYANGAIVVKMYDFNLINKYEGYGKNTRSESFSGKIAEYEENEAKLKAGELKGKERKEAAEQMENTSDSFNQCQIELDRILNSIKKAL